MKRIFIPLLTVMLVLSLCGCQKETAKKNAASADAKKKERIAKTDKTDKAYIQPIDDTSITFKDNFISDSINDLHIRWDAPDNADTFRITAATTGQIGTDSVITNNSSSAEKTVYNGTSNETDIKIKRNYLYKFRFKAYSSNKENASSWSEINYFPATDNSDNVVEDTSDGPNCLAGLDESGIGAWHRHGNVLYLTKDYKYLYAKDSHMSDHNNNTQNETIILDLAGHTITADQFTFSGDSSYIITDSIGGGKIISQKFIQLTSGRGKIIINDGTFSNQIEIYAEKTGKAVINDGNFSIVKSREEYYANEYEGEPDDPDIKNKPEISDAIILYAYDLNKGNITINGGTFSLKGNAEIEDKKNLVTSISSDKVDNKKYTVNGTLKLSSDGKNITLTN